MVYAIIIDRNIIEIFKDIEDAYIASDDLTEHGLVVTIKEFRLK